LNIEKERATAKKYNEEHKDEIRERHRLWSKEPYTCQCGRTFRRDRLQEHLKTSIFHNPKPSTLQ
jgi:hypothetical protein